MHCRLLSFPFSSFQSTRRLLTQLVEAPELKNAKFVPDKGFHVSNRVTRSAVAGELQDSRLMR